MKTLVLGGGIAGLSCAVARQERGDEVEILEAREDVGLETSYGNGGLLSAALCEPWNQPGISKIMIPALLGGKNSMLRIHPKTLPLSPRAPWRACALHHASTEHPARHSQEPHAAPFLQSPHEVKALSRIGRPAIPNAWTFP